MLENLFAPLGGLGELILRLALGITFFAHGLSQGEKRGRLRRISQTDPRASSVALCLARRAARDRWGGAAHPGDPARVMALGLAVDMLVALVTVRIAKAPFVSGQESGWDFEFMLLATALALVFTGGGRFSIDRYLGL